MSTIPKMTAARTLNLGIKSTIPPIQISDIQNASHYLKDKVFRTPLIPLNCDDTLGKIYLKLENLQPVGSFKLRGACHALGQLSQVEIKDGVYTCSAGNFAQGLAWSAQKLAIPCTIIVPDTAPQTKLDAIRRYGGKVIKVPYDTWWNTMVTRQFSGVAGHFIHPVCEKEVIAGNGTIGLEILEDLPEVDTIIGPFGGGGHLCGIASAAKHLKPSVKVLACEVDCAAPLTASRAAGEPVTLTEHRSTFVDGMGGKSVFSEMWPLVSSLIDDTVLLTVKEISDAVRLLVERNHVVAEGAGAAPVAAAMKHEVLPGENIVCVISGGNIDTSVLAKILNGEVP